MRTSHMMAWVYLIYLLCVLPRTIFSEFILKNVNLPKVALEAIDQFFMILFSINSGINPVVYALTNRQLRNAYRLLLTNPCWRWAHLRHEVAKMENTSELESHTPSRRVLRRVSWKPSSSHLVTTDLEPSIEPSTEPSTIFEQEEIKSTDKDEIISFQEKM